MAAQWNQERKVDEILEQRRMEGSSLQEVMRKVPELVVHERVTRQRSEGLQRKEKSIRMVYERDEGKAGRCSGDRH